MSTNTIDSTAATATSQRRPAKPEGGRKSAKSAKAKPAKKSQAAAKPKVRRANKKAEVIDLMRRTGGATLARSSKPLDGSATRCAASFRCLAARAG